MSKTYGRSNRPRREHKKISQAEKPKSLAKIARELERKRVEHAGHQVEDRVTNTS